MEVLTSKVDLNCPTIQSNYLKMQEICEKLQENLHKSLFQGPEKYLKKNKQRGKLLARERVDFLIDEDSPFLELMPFAGIGQDEMTLGGSIVSGIGLVKNTLCLIIANVQTNKGGAINEMGLLKQSRLDEIALENKLPVIYLNESAGADLPQQSKIFNYGGKTFREITKRSKLGIPSIACVFGSSTAGGAYIPGLSDYVIMVKDQAKTYLAGPPLVKMAINEDVDDETLGGAQMHSSQSGLCDYLAEDEKDALLKAREMIEQFNFRQEERGEGAHSFQDPRFDSEDLLKVCPADIRTPFDIKEVITRIVDGSEFSEFRPNFGTTLVTGFATIFGMKVGILGNNGVLFSDSANKGCHFIQHCNQRNIPLLFLQNITGFMVGKEAEENGIIKNGAKLINAVTNSDVPAITVIVGGSYGAGNYGMCGRAYSPRFLFTWPNSKIAVMGPDQLVGVLDILQKQKESKKSSLSPHKLVDKAKSKLIKEGLRKRIEEESSAYFATSRVWDDGVIDPRKTREVVGFSLEVIYSQPISSENKYGIFRM